MNEHRGVVNRLVWMQEAYTLDRSEVVLQKTPMSFDVSVWELQKTPMSFDVSVWELFWPLLSGRCADAVDRIRRPARMQLTESEGHTKIRCI
ncbi:hypothetical protein [Xanthomonas sp. MUS 060]|uniref:hypothetical protein n=1 Tax=Xanthomonas sp. MUS 060 TaxID=1588031 RepID=UPI0005F2ECBB|nr:hypothetical protein [Xanthomonas sp. MUS 060]